jgi:hypothetical protein
LWRRHASTIAADGDHDRVHVSGAWADASVAALQDIASDVLDGDFGVFTQLDDLIRARRDARLREGLDAGGSS